MGTHAVFQELEDLRRMLETPSRLPFPEADSSQGSKQGRAASSGGHAKAQPKPYETVLKGAEKGVTRLSRAIDIADDEMDAALQRTEEVHRIASGRRALEIAELRKVIASKERGIDSLRETFSCTKRALESRVSHLEEALLQRDQEVAALRNELGNWRDERQQLTYQNHQLVHQLQSIKQEHAQVHEEMQCSLRQGQATIKSLRHDMDQLIDKCNEHKRHTVLATEKASAETEARARLADSVRCQNEEIEHLLGTIHTLKEKLRAERRVRKASEKWLRAELKSREDMESLFATVRDIALSNNVTDEEADRVKHMIDGLRLERDPGARIDLARGAPKLDGDRGRRLGPRNALYDTGPGELKNQLADAKRLLSEQLHPRVERRKRSPYR